MRLLISASVISMLLMGTFPMSPERQRREFSADDEKEKAAQEKFFLENIRPVLFDTCLKCHGPEKSENGLRVDSRQALIDGGETGEAIVPEKPEASLLLKALKYEEQDLQMPPESKLDEKIAKNFEKWIKEGAIWADPPKNPK